MGKITVVPVSSEKSVTRGVSCEYSLRWRVNILHDNFRIHKEIYSQFLLRNFLTNSKKMLIFES